MAATDLMSVYTNDVAGKQRILLDETRIDQRTIATFLRGKINNRMNSIFNRPGLTPQEAIDAFGTSAVSMLVRNDAAVTFVTAVLGSAGLVTPATFRKVLTRNVDGTVTVTDEE